MAKQLNKVEVNLEISASTEKAKKAFMDLNKSLSDLQNQNLINPDNGIRQAAQDARELQDHLSKAVNVDTGRLDLNRFSNSLKSSKKELKDYYNSLMKLGDQGEQAFMQLSRSIATAETSTVRVNKKMQEFATTLKNAARWQVSSSILHGLMGAVQGAYGYAKDLDSALNDIRIVTGLSADEMDKFAVKANHAAKALSTTTTEYAKASLIYFQQGLSDSQVEERTAITMKMANAAGASAETISDQLTAVWNNFYDGSQSLEHYADAMVRLGADTASSSDEIATGLEKFASIGQVIGLGFDEAASALATVTAQTRQSAEVVGTAFKTIFARIQGLNLGETLDDGTTLNKYSEALAKVGISIKNEYGGIKDMNTLLDEMGEKWNLISKDRQIALAQAVGGVRQYNQIVALMDNYDFYQQNLNAAKGADGSLEEQAAVYAESWEASEDRVRAAAEGVYDSLINEDFFIEFNNNLSTLLEGVEGLIDGLGGMEGVLSMIGSLALRYFAKDIPSALSNTKDNIVGLLGLDSKGAKKTQKENDELTDSDYLDNTDPNKKVRIAQIEGTKTLNAMNQQLNANLKSLSAEEKSIYETKIKQVEKDYELLELQGRELEQEEKTTKELQNQIAAAAAKKQVEEENNNDKKIREDAMAQAERELASKKPSQRNEKKWAAYEKKLNTRAEEIYQQNTKGLNSVSSNRRRIKDKTESNKDRINDLKAIVVQEEKLIAIQDKINKKKKTLGEIKDTKELKKSTLEFVDSLKEVDKESDAYKNLVKALKETDITTEKAQAALDAFKKELTYNGKTFDEYEKDIDELYEGLSKLGMDTNQLAELEEKFRRGAISAEEFEAGVAKIRKGMEDLPNHTVETSEAIAELGSGIMGLVGMASGVENLFDVFNDKNAGAIQKISAVMGGLTTIVTASTGVYKGLNSVINSNIVKKFLEKKATEEAAEADVKQTITKTGLAGATAFATKAVKAFTTALMINPVLIATVAITALVAVIAGVAANAEKAKEKQRELAAELKETANASKEQTKENENLRKSFESLLEEYKNNAASKQELADTTKDLAEKYGIENAELLLLTENYDELIKKIRTYNQEQLKQAKVENVEALQAAEKVFNNSMAQKIEAGTNGISSGTYRYMRLNIDKDKDNLLGNASKTLQEKGLISSTDKNDTERFVYDSEWSFNEDVTLEEKIKYYEDLLTIKDHLQATTEAEILAEHEGYQELKKYLKDYEEEYNNIIQLKEEGWEISVQTAVEDALNTNKQIKSLEDYKALEEQITKDLEKDKSSGFSGKTTDEIQKVVRQALMAENAFSKIAKEAEVLDYAFGKIKKADLQNYIKNAFEGMSDEEKQIFATLNFDRIQTEEDFNNQLKLLQLKADESSIKVKIDTVEAAKSSLKDNMTTTEYMDYKESSGISWGQDGIINYTQFLKMTYEEQAEYLKGLTENYYDEFEGLGSKIGLIGTEIISVKKKIEGSEEDGKVIPGAEEVLKEAEKGLSEEEKQAILRLNPDNARAYEFQKAQIKDKFGLEEDQIAAYYNAYNNLVGLEKELEDLRNQRDTAHNDKEVFDNRAIGETKQQLQEIAKIFTNLEDGQIISEDQYKVLVENGLTEAADAFYQTADGSYKLKTGIKELTLTWEDYANLRKNGAWLFEDKELANVIIDVNELNEAYAAGELDAEVYTRRFNELFQSSIANIKSLEDLNKLIKDFNLKEEEASYALLQVASNYESCAQEAKEYEMSLARLSEDPSNEELKKQAAAAKDNLYATMMLEDASNKYGLEIEELTVQSNALQNEYKDLIESGAVNKKQIAALTIENQRMNRGVKSLVDNWDDWKKTLKSTNKDTLDWAKTAKECTKVVADLTGASEDLVLPAEFFDTSENLALIEKAAKGDTEAIQLLGVAVAEAQVSMIQFNENMYGANYDNVFDEDTFNTWRGHILEGLKNLKEELNNFGSSITFGDDVYEKLGGDKFVTSLNEMAMATGMSVEQMNSMLNSMGVQTEVIIEKKKTKVNVPWYATRTDESVDKDGNKILTTHTVDSGLDTIDGEIEVAQINTGDAVGNKPKFTYIGSGSVSPGSTTKTDKGSSTKNTGPKKSVKPERYKEINDKLDDASNAYEKASKAVDRFYGPQQITKMREANKELSKEISLLKIKQKQANDYLNKDREALEKAGADLGLEVNIDNNDFITNYTNLMDQADKKLKDAYANAGDTIDDEQREVLDALEKKVEDFEAAIAQFDETRETLEDIENEVLDKTYEKRDRNFEILNKELEIKIDIDDRALNKLEYYADKFSDNFYKLAETYALIIKGVNDEGVGKIDLAKDKLAQYAGTRNDDGMIIYGDYMRKLESDHHYNLISQAQYVEGLKNAETSIRDTLTELNGYDKEIFGAYENVLNEASSTIEDHVDHIEHLSGVFDHYLTLMEMFGKQKEYAAMDNFLSGKVDTIRDRLDIAKEYYETLKETNNAGEYWDKYQEALKSGNEDEINWWKQQWDAEIDALDAAQEEMLNLTEEWAEARRAVIENHIAEAADALEKSLTNGYGFEFLNDEWDKMNTRQEEYLDNVNKVYETNKLMRTAQKALDETDNKVAKQKLKSFIDETQHLQENTNLSKHELEIQQAKYDLLLAEIALEEAQNAKSVVRLSRDNEGNFGYVYTADQDKVADAQQGVDDKRNDLYNLTLEGQKEYMEKYLQASQEMYDELNVLQEDYLNGLITEDEFKIRSESIKKYYQGSFEFQNEMSALEQAYRNGEIKNEEEYNLKQQEILNKYQAEDLGILNQYLYLASVSNRLAKEEDKILQDKYNSESIEDEKAYNKEKEDLINTFASNSTGILGDFLSFYKGESEEVNNKVADHWDNGLDFISHNTSDWVDDMDGYLNEIENGVKDWADTYEDANEDVGNALKDSSRATEDLTDESKALKDQIQNKVIPAVQKEIKAVRDLTSEYGNQRAELLRLIETYEDYLDKLGQKIDAESNEEEKPAGTSSSATTSTTSDANNEMGDNTTSSKNEKIKIAAENLLERAQLGQIANQNTLGWEAAAKKNNYNAKAINMVKKALNDSVPGYGVEYDYEKAKELLKTYNPDSFDTGGYTGMWGPEGKLALLHEKEIVLNKDDTENLLKTVSFIRELVSMIDSQASMSSLFNMTATTGIMTGNAGMEQQITIYADFPDATDHNEIEMAFNTLLNTASQYANRK